eukprot:scaffold276004_cov29-Prasinocladus_malaysianus.AAC.1
MEFLQGCGTQIDETGEENCSLTGRRQQGQNRRAQQNKNGGSKRHERASAVLDRRIETERCWSLY